MSRVLLTGGSGFIASYILTDLLSHGHSVVTTVRSDSKAQSIRALHPNVSEDKLSFAIVPDVAKENAFDHVFSSSPSRPFDSVIHTASPFHYDVKDVETELLQPAIVGTTSILKAIAKYAPSVKRVVLTSSFVAIMDFAKPPSYQFTDKDWNPITREQALSGGQMGYCASKTYAEQAAWKFVKDEKPNFDLATIHPVYVFGPIGKIESLEKINESNKFIRDAMDGTWKEKGLPEDPPTFFVDVRDVAAAHVAAMETKDAGGKRFITSGGNWDVNSLVDTIRETVTDEKVKENLPTEKKEGLEEKTPVPIDTSLSKEILGIKYRGLKESVKDTAESILMVQREQ